jgi:hypothetical protein
LTGFYHFLVIATTFFSEISEFVNFWSKMVRNECKKDGFQYEKGTFWVKNGHFWETGIWHFDNSGKN